MKQASIFRQVLLNLLAWNNVDDPTNAIGDSLSQEIYDQAKDNIFVKADIMAYQGILFTYFGEHMRQANLMVQYGADYYGKIVVALLNQVFDAQLKGVSCFAAARQTNKTKYARIAK